MRYPKLILAALTAVSMAVITSGGALAAPAYQPDVFVSGSVGEGVHDATGVGQFKKTKLHAGQKKVLPFWNRNDGANVDSFTYWGCAAYGGPFRVKWFDWQGVEVTAQVEAGTFATPALSPGWSEQMLDLQVKARSSAKPKDILRCDVLATSVGDGTQDRAGYRLVAVD